MMKRTLNLQANLIAEQGRFEWLDKLIQTWYNTLMRKTNNITRTKKGNYMSYTFEIVAARLPVGLTNEKDIIRQTGKVLEDMGMTYVERNFHMNVDADFLPEVLSHYNG